MTFQQKVREILVQLRTQRSVDNEAFDQATIAITALVDELIGEDDEYHKLNPCMFCSEAYQYKCSCADTRNALRTEQRQKLHEEAK